MGLLLVENENKAFQSKVVKILINCAKSACTALLQPSKLYANLDQTFSRTALTNSFILTALRDAAHFELFTCLEV